MADFMIHFLICNLFISGIVGILLIIKRVFKNSLTSRMQYHLWFLLLGLLTVPFMPLRPIGLLPIFSWLEKLKNTSAANEKNIITMSANRNLTETASQMNDFALSVSRRTPSIVGSVLCGIWITGILAMLVLIIKSKIRLNTLKKSALPLQNKEVHVLYNHCLNELKITADIPIYSTAFLKSPIIVGVFRPCIYLPIHLISDYHAADMRYMILHELQHYKHKDALVNYLMNLIGVLYWFNPIVWYVLKEMHDDREIACDTSVLKILEENDYEDYGNTLINLAEKVSLVPFPFSAGISGNMKQMERRIINIASYQKPSVWKKLKGVILFGSIAAILFSLAPVLSTYAADRSHYQWETSSRNIAITDLSAYFNGYEGSFVLYDLGKDVWNIYDMEYATLRTSPNSTYKIYDSLFGLEKNIITPEDSLIAWDKTDYPFEAWNSDQNLQSAMQSSVNWYFQTIDKRLGISAVKHCLQQIGYGNENINADIFSYWLESSLKISPVEQVELLTKLYTNSLNFSSKNMDTVKNCIHISSSKNGDFYGKTGTGRINEKDINGWFIGYIETKDNTYLFATNIQAAENASGSMASKISLSILSDMGIWKQ